MGKKLQDSKPQYLELLTSSYSYCDREPNSDDEWDRGDTARDWEFLGVRLTDKDSSYALPADFPVQVGDTVYVLYAVYSTGDTFGHDSGAYMEFLSVHKNEALAKENLASVEGRTDSRDQYKMVLKFDNGNSVERHCPWDGYFESLDYVRLESFMVQ